MRQDPDIIMVGEMRDIETMATTIKASETGHLVFSTLHTTTAVQTIERIISTFPDTQHEIVREQLATNLRATITQSLVKRASGSGRYAAQEILVNLPIVKKLMLEHRTDDIVSIMRSGQEGMQVFDQALANLVREQKITYEEGLTHAKDEFAYRRYVKGVAVSSDAGGILG
jgi:twitching motility protein PilT